MGEGLIYSLRKIINILTGTILCVTLYSAYSRAQEVATDQTILFYQKMLQRNPHDSKNHLRLGDAYIRKARESGDFMYFDLAEKAIRKSLEITPRYESGMRYLSYVLYSRHAFEDAAATAIKALELDPSDSHAYGVLGDAYLEMGKYEKARETYEKMMRIEKDLDSYSRLYGLQSVAGDTEGAIKSLLLAVNEGRERGRPRESIAWVQWQLGCEHLAVGDLKNAEAAFFDALKTFPGYYRALAGLAQTRAAQRRYPEAIDLYKKAVAVLPLPDYVAALGDLYLKTERPDDAKKHYDLVEYMGLLNAANKILYNRELAYFYADHDIKVKDALRLAKIEIEIRKDIYAFDVLAWALFKNGRLLEASDAMKEALKQGTRDARLFFHAGMIQYQLNNYRKAREYLSLALPTNPYFHPFHADTAKKLLDQLDQIDGEAAKVSSK